IMLPMLRELCDAVRAAELCSACPGLRPGPTQPERSRIRGDPLLSGKTRSRNGAPDLHRKARALSGLAHHGLGTEGTAAGVDGDFAEAFGAFLRRGIGRGGVFAHARD